MYPLPGVLHKLVAESQPNELLQPTLTIRYEVQDNSIIVDEGDVFQCGKCRNKFSFSDFVIHKKSNCLGFQIEQPSIEPSYQLECDSSSTSLQPLVLDGNLLDLVENENTQTPPEIVTNFSGFEDTNEVDDVFGFKFVDNSFEANSLLQNNFILQDDKVLSKDNREELNFDLNDPPNPRPPTNNKDTKKSETPNCKKIEIKCSFCGKEFKKNFDRKQHERSHTGERPFLCVVCGRGFSQKSNVSKHMGTHKVWPTRNSSLPNNPFHAVIIETHDDVKVSRHKSIIAIDKSFVCQYCGSIMNCYLEWKTHMKSHRNEKVYKCVQKTCNLTFSDTDSFLAHSETHFGQAVYTCHICLEEFRSLDDLGLHQYSHNSNSKQIAKKNKCRKCGNKCVNEESHKCNVYSCPKCDKSFYNERMLRRHLPIHSSLSLYSCSECGKAFRTPKSLSLHGLVHTTEKRFICTICSAAFVRRDKLVRHKLSHESVKKFKCPFTKSLGCTMGFNRKDKLKQHVLTHDPINRLRKTVTPQKDVSSFDFFVLPTDSAP